ncbi:MAG: hypothetical protein KGJ79_15965 [Alphaproteobacteria bacterium]|nr:hypothetical protein [Alphaproteobacteria bacterium]MDE2112637.1 hypothetical protein [Alphaproteobacteria bacterium]MDE2493752.1 hypothetical protein [Alphaproteobacteria bacterium]
MRAVLVIVGIAALFAGLFFAGQGLGYIPWPRTSFMVSDIHWAYYGAGIALVGLVLSISALRRGG